MFWVNNVLTLNYEVSSLADKAIIFYIKFRLVYILTLVDWVKLDPAK